jgi:hypothetical protein
VRQEFIMKMAQQKEDIKQAKEDVEKDKSKEDKKMDPSTPAAARKEVCSFGLCEVTYLSYSSPSSATASVAW